jgi:hypothetical protein
MFQGEISDDDLIALQKVHDAYYEILTRCHFPQPSMDDPSDEFGSIYLPAFRSRSATVFVHRNTDGMCLRAPEIMRIVAKIDQALEATFMRVKTRPHEAEEKANKSPEATTLARTPAADAPVAPAVGRASS